MLDLEFNATHINGDGLINILFDADKDSVEQRYTDC